MELEQDFFALLGLPRSLAVDSSSLKKAARSLLLQYHPDKLVNATPQEQRLAAQFTAHINHAKTVLADPVARASHLLTLIGLQSNFDNKTIRDREFLMQQMMLREAFEEAEQPQELEDLSNELEDALSDIHKQFTAVDFQQEADSAVAQSLEDALAKMHFYEKLADDVRLKRRSMQSKSS